MNSHTLLIFDVDVRTRSWKEWLLAHTSFSKPLHRYEGELSLLNDKLYFEGLDKRAKENDEVEIIIFRQQITEI